MSLNFRNIDIVKISKDYKTDILFLRKPDESNFTIQRRLDAKLKKVKLIQTKKLDFEDKRYTS